MARKQATKTRRGRRRKTLRKRLTKALFRRSKSLRKVRAFRNRMRRRVKVVRTLSRGQRPTKVRMSGNAIRVRVLAEWRDESVTPHTFYSALKLQQFTKAVHDQGGRIVSQTPF